MPSVVPTLIQDSAQLDTSTGRRRSQADASAFGGQEARALTNVAQGLDAAADVAVQKEDEFAEAEALELDNQYTRRIRERLYNPETGYLSTARGRNAVDGRGQVEADLDGIAAEIAASTQNRRAQAVFRDVAQRRLTAALGSVAEHSTRQQREYLNEQSEGRIQEAIDNMVAAYADPAVVAANRDTAVRELQIIGQREGWGEETLQSRTRQLQSDASSRVILQLAASDPEQAMDMYNRLRPGLSAQEAGELLTSIRAVRRQAEDDVIDQAWTYVASGQRVPRDLWARVPGRSQIDIQNEIRRRAEGSDRTGNRAMVSDLNVMAIANPGAFSRYDLRSVRGEIGESAYQSLAEEQARIRRGESRAGISREMAQGAMAMASRQLRAAGYNLSSDASEDDAARVAEFQGDLIGLLDRFVETNNRAPNAQEQLTTIQNLLAERVYDPTPGWGFDRRTSRATDTYTPYSQIPSADREAIVAAMRQDGQPVTRANIERIYELREIRRLRAGRQQ